MPSMRVGSLAVFQTSKAPFESFDVWIICSILMAHVHVESRSLCAFFGRSTVSTISPSRGATSNPQPLFAPCWDVVISRLEISCLNLAGHLKEKYNKLYPFRFICRKSVVVCTWDTRGSFLRAALASLLPLSYMILLVKSPSSSASVRNACRKPTQAPYTQHKNTPRSHLPLYSPKPNGNPSTLTLRTCTRHRPAHNAGSRCKTALGSTRPSTPYALCLCVWWCPCPQASSPTTKSGGTTLHPCGVS